MWAAHTELIGQFHAGFLELKWLQLHLTQWISVKPKPDSPVQMVG